MLKKKKKEKKVKLKNFRFVENDAVREVSQKNVE